ncbi:MAG: NADH-quinone oxidoreductase subunit A [Planctomycetes bacterium]|nr:NADH-quinone oxidoreductase subunit A [Planctomycetota bacterium]
MNEEAVWLAVYILFVVSVAVAVVVLSRLLGPRRKAPGKLTPYECGVPLREDVPGAIRVRFYLVAILFLLFDVEAALLIGWAVVHRSLSEQPDFGLLVVFEVVFFLALLGVALVYGIRRGALQWD